jgi:hypothetical protein
MVGVDPAGPAVCARLLPPGTSSASATAAAASPAAPLSLRTAMHNIGTAGGW